MVHGQVDIRECADSRGALKTKKGREAIVTEKFVSKRSKRADWRNLFGHYAFDYFSGHPGDALPQWPEGV